MREALGRAFGLDWDRRFLEVLEEVGWSPLMQKRYVDDGNTVIKKLEPGMRFVEGRLEVQEELVEGDRRRAGDELTMSVFGDIANSIDPDMEVEVDYPSNHSSKWMPIQKRISPGHQPVFTTCEGCGSVTVWGPYCGGYSSGTSMACSRRVRWP